MQTEYDGLVASRLHISHEFGERGVGRVLVVGDVRHQDRKPSIGVVGNSLKTLLEDDASVVAGTPGIDWVHGLESVLQNISKPTLCFPRNLGELDAVIVGKIDEKPPCPAGIEDCAEAALNYTSRLRHQHRSRRQLVDGTYPDDTVPVEQGLVSRIVSGKRPRVTLGEKRALLGPTNLQGYNRDVPILGLLESGAESFGVADSFKEERDRAGLFILQHEVQIIGG